ncbi:MAG: transposase [Chlorobi bacterium]|nr:transposase [Chlorobiota bacterium]
MKPKLHEPDTEELQVLEIIDQEFTRHPFYGSRRMTHYLRRQGYRINRKRVQRLMLKLGLAGVSWRIRKPVSRIRSTRCLRICCAVSRSAIRIRSGALT